MTTRFLQGVAVAAAAAICACSRPPGERAETRSAPAPAPAPTARTLPAPSGPGTPTGAPVATPDPAAPVDPAPGTPAPAPVAAAVAIAGGLERALSPDGKTVVEPGASFRVDVAARVVDGRLAVHDASDAMVASTGSTEVGASMTRFTVAPEAPLAPGSSYALRLDGSAARELHDAGGRAYAPVMLALETTGERPAAPPRKKRTRRSR